MHVLSLLLKLVVLDFPTVVFDPDPRSAPPADRELDLVDGK